MLGDQEKATPSDSKMTSSSKGDLLSLYQEPGSRLERAEGGKLPLLISRFLFQMKKSGRQEGF